MSNEYEAEYSQGIMGGEGPVVLKDGVPMSVDGILADLNRMQEARASSAGAVPEGFALVPIEPTEHQVYAAEFLIDDVVSMRQSSQHAIARAAYKAMITAAPTAPVEGGGVPVAYAAVNGANSEAVAGLFQTEELAELGAQRIGGDVRPLMFADTHPHNGEQGGTEDRPVDIALDVLRSVKARIIESHAERAPSAERAISHVFEAIRIEGESRTPMGYNPP